MSAVTHAGTWLGLTAAAWSVVAAWVGVLVAVLAAGFAAVQVLNAKNDREERQRPQIDVDLAPTSAHGIVSLSVKNIGQTVARDVHLTWDPPLPDSAPDGQQVAWDYLRRFTDRRWAYVAPGKSYTTIFTSLLQYPDDGPSTWAVTVACKDYSNKQQHPHTVQLDFEDIRPLMRVEERTLSDGVDALKEIHKLLGRAIDGSGLHVVTETEAEVNARETARWAEAKAQIAELERQRAQAQAEQGDET